MFSVQKESGSVSLKREKISRAVRGFGICLIDPYQCINIQK